MARAASSSTPVANASWSGSMSLLNWRLAMLSPNRSQGDGRRCDHVYVDGRMLGEETWRVRFPTIWAQPQAGINPATDLIPSRPRVTTLRRRKPTSTVQRTWSACTPAERWHPPCARCQSACLNSPQGLVFARRIAVRLQDTPSPADLGAGSPATRTHRSIRGVRRCSRP